MISLMTTNTLALLSSLKSHGDLTLSTIIFRVADAMRFIACQWTKLSFSGKIIELSMHFITSQYFKRSKLMCA